MQLKTLHIASPLLLVLACDAANDETGLPESTIEFTGAGGKADGSCVDVVGFDICGHEAKDVYAAMSVQKEETGVFFGPDATNGIIRVGTFLGQDVTCNNFDDGQPLPINCTFPIATEIEGIQLWWAMGFHGDVERLEDEERIELREFDLETFKVGDKTGITRINSTRQVGVYKCTGHVDFVGFSNEVVLDDSKMTCTARIVS